MLVEKNAKAWVEDGLNALYGRLAKGLDVSPKQLYHLEGQVNLLIQNGLVDIAWVQARVEFHYQAACKKPVDPLFWQWAADDNSFYLPVKTVEAPVYRS